MHRNNKVLKQILALLFSSIFTLSVVLATAGVSLNSDIETRALMERLENQSASNEAYNRLLMQFEGQSMSRSSDEQRYPDYYAGAYIGEDGNLVVLTKNADIQEINTLASICNNSSVTFASTTYSYNELIDIMNTFSTRSAEALESGEYDSNAISISVRDDKNKVYVGVSNPEDTEFLAYLTNGVAPGCYAIYQAEELHKMASLVPGDYIDGATGGSAAYKAKLIIDGEEKIGFVTAAHVTGGSDVYEGAIHLWGKIGNTIIEQESGSVDAAFVELTGSSTFSNTIDGYQIETDITVIPAIGSTVYKTGSSSHTTSGIVYSNINESQWLDDNNEIVTFTNLVETSVPCENGDSGGLMYTKDGNTYEVVGIIRGGNESTGVSYATKASLLPWNISVIS